MIELVEWVDADELGDEISDDITVHINVVGLEDNCAPGSIDIDIVDNIVQIQFPTEQNDMGLPTSSVFEHDGQNLMYTLLEAKLSNKIYVATYEIEVA